MMTLLLMCCRITRNLIYLRKSATSEHAARMTAMDNSSKNASDMLNKLMLMFNLTRTAIIVKELIEIFSGAAAQNS